MQFSKNRKKHTNLEGKKRKLGISQENLWISVEQTPHPLQQCFPKMGQAWKLKFHLKYDLIKSLIKTLTDCFSKL